MDKNTYSLYWHVNKINNKKYIGITSVEPSSRWKNGEGYKKQNFYRAIQKYGWDGFNHEVLYSNLSREEACRLEQELIEKYNTINDKYGYNVAKGGDIDDASGLKINQYDLFGRYIKTFSSREEARRETKCSISSSTFSDKSTHKSGNYLWYYATDNNCCDIIPVFRMVSMYDLDGNYIRSFELPKYAADFVGTSSILDALKKRYSNYACGYLWEYTVGIPKAKIEPHSLKYMRRKVCQYTLDGILINTYENIKEASKITNINHDAIQRCCTRLNKTCNGFVFLYENDSEDFSKIKPKQKTVAMYDSNMNELQIFKSCYQAEKITGIPRSNISSCCLGKQKDAGGYIWKYVA